MLLKYRPEDRAAKKDRLLKKAQAEAEGKSIEAEKPIVVKYGLNHVAYLIEQVVHHVVLHMIAFTAIPLCCWVSFGNNFLAMHP